MTVIDATNLIMGRMASQVAKRLLLGENIDLINCEKAYITGRKRDLIERFRQRRMRGDSTHGPWYPRMPERLVKRMIRNMLPFKQPRGRVALKRLKCHMDVPAKFANEKPETFKNANISRLTTLRYMSIKEICKEMGAKI